MDTVDKIRAYYSLFESRIGYTYLLNNSKHLGYYPKGVIGIDENQAQEIYQDNIGKVLDLSPLKKVLDAGCGRGVVACYLAKKSGVKIVGVDLLDFEIKQALKRAEKMNLQDLTTFRVEDYSKLEYDQEFDAVYANETLSHAPNLELVFKCLFKALKTGGKIVILEYVLSEEKDFTTDEKKVLDFIIENFAMVGLKQFRIGKVSPILQRIGYSNIQEVDITENIKPSFFRLSRIARKVYPIVKLLGLEKKFINATAGYTLYPLVKKGLIHYYQFTASK